MAERGLGLRCGSFSGVLLGHTRACLWWQEGRSGEPSQEDEDVDLGGVSARSQLLHGLGVRVWTEPWALGSCWFGFLSPGSAALWLCDLRPVTSPLSSRFLACRLGVTSHSSGRLAAAAPHTGVGDGG